MAGLGSPAALFRQAHAYQNLSLSINLWKGLYAFVGTRRLS